MATEIETASVPQVIKAMQLVYGRLIAGSTGRLPRFEDLLVAGRRVSRGLSREFGPTTVEFVLGDLVVDHQLRTLAGRIGYQIALEERPSRPSTPIRTHSGQRRSITSSTSPRPSPYISTTEWSC